MIDKPHDGFWFFLVLIVAITGAIGGCGGAAHIFLSGNRPVRLMQVVAYGVLGMMMSLLAIGLLSFLNKIYDLGISWPLETIVGFSLAFGFGGSLLLSGTNVLLQWTTKYFGKWEVNFTARQDHVERRKKRKKKKR